MTLPVPVSLRTGSRLSFRGRIARTLLRMVAARVPVDIRLPDGTRFGPAGGAPELPRIEVRRPDQVFTRIGAHPKFGVGESYTAGDWEVGPHTDLAVALAPFAQNLTRMLPGWMLRLRGWVDHRIPSDQRGARHHTQQNIAAHYDLSNDMFAAFLDPSLTYSSALFDPTRPLAEQSLEEAQLRKIASILDAAAVGPGVEVLEIGTGWGTLAIEAARRGATVRTVTLSVEQAELARERIARAGLSASIEVLVCDYRDVAGRYDAVVSVEMIEAVGDQYWPEYFAALSRLVRPGGTVALQAIVMSHERYLATRNSFGWIQKHIFPGGLIPSETALAEQAAAVRLADAQVLRFGADYAETLHRWRQTFLAAWPQIRSEKFGEEFRRTWEFYLAYCEAGFRTGYLDVAQIVWSREPDGGGGTGDPR